MTVQSPVFEPGDASPREAQELMRVSSLALIDRYTRSFRLTDSTCNDRGPSLCAAGLPPIEAAKATGTGGKPESVSRSFAF